MAISEKSILFEICRIDENDESENLNLEDLIEQSLEFTMLSKLKLKEQQIKGDVEKIKKLLEKNTTSAIVK